MRRVALIGLPGAGKTTVAPLLAARLGLSWTDLDADVAREAGRSIAAIFAEEGEESFRVRELKALRDAFAAPGGVVIACGGGVVCHGLSRDTLREGATVVWLRAEPETAAARLGPAGLAARPLLAGAGGRATAAGGVAALVALLAARAPLYAAAADLRVATDGLSAEACVTAAAAAVRERWANSES